jgi:membrane protease YdiL (CAAX protease family)
MRKDNVFLAIWRCLYPMLIHLAVTFILAFAYMFVVSFWLGFKNAGNMDVVAITQQVMDSYTNNALYLLLLTSAICIPVFALLCRADRKREQKERKVETSKMAWILLVILAVAMCVSLNSLIGMSGLEKFSKSYQEVANTLYSGGIVLELLAVGILGPICEELVFRGLMFQRLCGYVKPMIAVVVSALMFGIYHGNIVQGVYAFFLGMIMALCCWRFGSIWAPIVIHVVANITSVCITEIPIIGNMFEQTSVVIVATIMTTILWIGISVFLLKKISKKNWHKKDKEETTEVVSSFMCAQHGRNLVG